MRALSVFALSILCAAASSHAQLNESSTVTEVEFSQLSQRDPNPLAEKALAIHPELWKHAESEHFIYHYIHSYVATSVSIEAEFHYRVVAKELERDQTATDTKSNVYIFESLEDWQEFQGAGELEKWTGGIHSGGSLFIHRDPKFKFSGNVLGHEIVHLVIHRFYPDGIPLWLNEGMAQYISKAARASYQRARGYIAKPHSVAVADSDFIPVSQLVAMTRVPNDRVEAFYEESERLVRFLATDDKRSFLTFFDSLGRHRAFDNALLTNYAGKFQTTAILEEKFRDYASKDYGTALSQIDSD